MEVDDDNYYYIDLDEYRPVVVRDEEEMKNIVHIANELFYDPARYPPEDISIVRDMVNKMLNPIPDTLYDLYEFFIHSTLLYFVSEGFDISRVHSPYFTAHITIPNAYDYIISQENKVPADWRNAIDLIFLRIDGELQCSNDRFAEYLLKIRDRFYNVRILLRGILREVCIFLSPYSVHGEVIFHETDPQAIINVEIARSFLTRHKWLHFGFYLRYNILKIFHEEMRRAQGHSDQSLRQMFRSPSVSYCSTPLLVNNLIEAETSTTDAPNPAMSGSSNKTTQFLNQTADERLSQGPSQQGPSQQWPSQQSVEHNYDGPSGVEMLIAAAQVLDQGWVPIDTEATSLHLSHTTYVQRPG